MIYGARVSSVFFWKLNMVLVLFLDKYDKYPTGKIHTRFKDTFEDKVPFPKVGWDSFLDEWIRLSKKKLFNVES